MSGEAKETPESRRLSEPWYVGIVIWATLGSVCSGVVAIASSDPSVGFLSIWYISLVFGSPFLAGYYIRGCVVVPLVGCFGLYAVASVFVFLEIRDLLNEPDLGIGALPVAAFGLGWLSVGSSIIGALAGNVVRWIVRRRRSVVGDNGETAVAAGW